MALTYNQVNAIAGTQEYQLQMAMALVKQAAAKVQNATGNELALAQAILKQPTAYAQRFLQLALVQLAGSLTSTDGSTLTPPPADSGFDGVMTTIWPLEVAAGV